MSGSVVLYSDFGGSSSRTAAMMGAVKTVDDTLDFYPVNIWIPKGDLRAASGAVYSALPFWPAGTVFLADVEKPSCGTRDMLLIVMANGVYLVCPNNGVATMPIVSLDVKEIRLVSAELMEGKYATATLAGKLAAGMIAPEQVGEVLETEKLCYFDMTPAKISKHLAEGSVTMVMTNFGNLYTNIAIDAFEETEIPNGSMIQLTITHKNEVKYQQQALFHHSFGYAQEGAPIVFNGSSGYMGFGLNQAKFTERCLPDILAEGIDVFDYKVRIELI